MSFEGMEIKIPFTLSRMVKDGEVDGVSNKRGNLWWAHQTGVKDGPEIIVCTDQFFPPGRYKPDSEPIDEAVKFIYWLRIC